MAYTNSRYGGVIWTNHALKRLADRRIKQGDAYVTFRNPDDARHGYQNGAWVYYRKIGHEKIEVVAKKNERGEWIILSVWSKPADGALSYQKRKSGTGFWTFVWRLITG